MIRFSILSDSNSETGVLHAKQSITSNDFYKFIEKQDYGHSLKGLCVIFMCRSPDIHFKQRIRLSKKEQTLYMDIMLDYHEFVSMTHEQRISAMCQKLLEEIPPIVRKYKFPDFDLDKFMNNLSYWFKEKGFII